VHGISTAAELLQSLERAKLLEQMLYSDGAVIIKLWLHLSKDKQEKRLNALHKNPATRWRVTDRDFKQLSAYDKFQSVHEKVIRHTNTIEAPWNIIEGADPYYRNLTVGKIILETLLNRLDQVNTTTRKINVAPKLPSVDNLHILKSLDLTKSIKKKKFKLELEKYQEKLNLLSRDSRFKEMSVIIVFEGNDAAGKGGSIRRITAALDARNYQVEPIAAPTEEERAQPYLWRFWRHIPRKRRVTIFDRSWYGRVLVERVEGYCSENDWLRAYNEINEFEAELVRHNILVVKFWLAISKEEQLHRFEDRQKTAYKSFKITEEDWRNREKWDEYEQAVCDMIDHTSTEAAPWTLVEANDKNYARIKILKTLCSQIEDMLDSLPSNEKTANK
jgi:polyphosphate:AMP phosphotransferase